MIGPARSIVITISIFTLALFFSSAPALADDTAKATAITAIDITAIDIVTPEWRDQTQADGSGLFFDIVRSIFAPEGIEMRFAIVPWKRAVMDVTNHRADALLDIYADNVEPGMLLPRHPIVIEYTAAVFKKGRVSDWRGPKSLDGFRAIWVREYDYHLNSHFKDVNLIWDEFDEYKTAWRVLEGDRVDVYIDALPDVERYIRDFGVDMTPYETRIVGENAGYMAFQDTERGRKLAGIHDRRIMELYRSGELKRIFEKWKFRYPERAWAQ